MSEEIKRLRRAQAKLVMPLIGPLLDAYEQLPNDLVSSIEDQAQGLAEAISAIQDAMENAE